MAEPAPDAGRVSGLAIVITCEHGGNRIPSDYRGLFARQGAVLESHRGHDPGALELARFMAASCGSPLIVSTISRLLVELNRSPHHPALFSAITGSLDCARREQILHRYYHPYRTKVEQTIRARLRRSRCVLHVSVHTFTPVLDGVVRRADAGLLYDPRRQHEAALCRAWQQHLRRAAPELVVRRNYPYRGVADGLTTSLRNRLPSSRYLGIELEVNQRFPLSDPTGWKRLQKLLVATLCRVVG